MITLDKEQIKRLHKKMMDATGGLKPILQMTISSISDWNSQVEKWMINNCST